jgi:hypothetical protein
MFRKTLQVIFITVSALTPFGAPAADKLVLKSVSVDLPFGGRQFPDGPGMETTTRNCLGCHSAGMVLNEGAMWKAQWRAEVDKMRTAYKAPIDSKDVDTIVNYLFAIKGAR